MIGCHQDLEDKKLTLDPGKRSGNYLYLLVKYFVSLLILCRGPLFPSCAMFPRKYFRREFLLGYVKEYDQNTRKDKGTFKVKGRSC